MAGMMHVFLGTEGDFMKVFYREEQVGPSQQASPSAHKAKFVVEDWIRCIRYAVELEPKPLSPYLPCIDKPRKSIVNFWVRKSWSNK